MCVALTARKVVRNVGQRSRRRRRLDEEEEKERGFDSLSGGLSFRRLGSRFIYIECNNKALLELELETCTKNGDSFSPLFLDDLDFDATAHHHHHRSILLDLCLSGVEETSSCDTREES